MATYIILTRLMPDAFNEPQGFKQISEAVSTKVKVECPGVMWKASFVTMGRFDIVDIVESDLPQQVEKAAMIIRGTGHAITETMPATPWKKYLSAL